MLRYLLICMICLITAGCGGDASDANPEEAVRAWVARGEAAAEDKERGALLEMISEDYVDGRGNDREKIGGVILLSADRHRTDVYEIKRPNGYTLYEFETSKLTNKHTHGTKKQAIFSYNKGNFFGLLTFDQGIAGFLPPRYRPGHLHRLMMLLESRISRSCSGRVLRSSSTISGFSAGSVAAMASGPCSRRKDEGAPFSSLSSRSSASNRDA